MFTGHYWLKELPVRRSPMRRRYLTNAFVLCCAVLAPVILPAQYPKVAKEKPGSLNGEVVTTKGASVPGAQIMWQAADGGIPHVLHTDGHGHFHIEPLHAGLYDVRASAGGTWSEWEHNVTVRPGSEANVTLRLSFKTAPVAVAIAVKGTMRTWELPVPGAGSQDPAIDPKGNVWFTLQETGHLARFNPDTHEWKLFKVPTPHSGPHGLVSDAAGNIWFTENYAGKIGRLDATSGIITEYIPPSAKDPHTPVFGPDGALWFTSQNSNLIGRLDQTAEKSANSACRLRTRNPTGSFQPVMAGYGFANWRDRSWDVSIPHPASSPNLPRAIRMCIRAGWLPWETRSILPMGRADG